MNGLVLYVHVGQNESDFVPTFSLPINPLPHMPILGSSNLAANEDISIDKSLVNVMIVWLMGNSLRIENMQVTNRI